MTSPSDDVRQELVALLPRLRRFARGLAGSREGGDDILQEACEKALGRLGQFEAGTRLDRWMLQIVKTTYIDHKRRERRRPASSYDDETFANMPYDARIEEAASARQALERIRNAVFALPEDQREVLMLVVADGLTYPEAAEIIGIPQGTVMSRLCRARQKLARAIDAMPVRDPKLERSSS